MIKKITIFSEDILKEIPIFYRLMEKEQTYKIGELYLKSTFSKSKRNFSKSYKVLISYKPISNFIIRKS